MLSTGSSAVPAAWAGQPATSAPATLPFEPTPVELSRLILKIAGQSEPRTRVDSAVAILDHFGAEGVRALLNVLEEENNEGAKLAICQAIAQVDSEEPAFIAPLMSLLDHKEPALREAASAALGGYDEPAVTARLKELERQLLEKRFMSQCKRLYQLLPTDPERVAQLQLWLRSALPQERLAALEIIHERMIAGTRPAPDLLQQIRQMLLDRDERVRLKLAVVLRDIRQSEDATRVRAALAQERSEVVREEMYKALGYLGDLESVPACIGGLQDPSDAVAAQAAIALGRLGEKSNGQQVPAVQQAVAALVDRARQPVANPLLREGIIEAMARIASPEFLPILVSHAAAEETVPAVRQTALRGIGLVGGSEQVPLVIDRLVNDPDKGVREVAAEALGKLGTQLEHVRVLRERLDPKVEPSLAVQNKAWEAYKAIFLRSLSQEDQQSLLDSWRETESASIVRRVELLADLEKQLSAGNANPQRLAALREELGDAYLTAGRGADAAAAFARTMEVLDDRSDGRVRVTSKLMEAHLRTPASEKAFALAVEARVPQTRELLVGRLLRHAQEVGASNRETAAVFLDKLAQSVPDRFGPDWAARFEEVRRSLPETRPADTQPRR
ncbi:MAG: hypothetical protein AMXMBFR13_25280 [Phycisphaerae bacterium]